LAIKSTEFGEITQNNGHYATQSYSSSPISIPVESPFRLPVCQ